MYSKLFSISANARYFKKVAGIGSGNYIYFWQSKGFSDEMINSAAASNYSITPELSYYGSKIRVKLNGSCLKQAKVMYNHGKTINIYTVYEKSKNYNISSSPASENSLFGVVRLTKHVDIDQYKYSGYGIGFDRKGTFSVRNEFGRNCIIFVVDMGSSVHIDNKKEDVLIPGEGPTQGLDGTALTAEKLYSINFTENNKIRNFV